MTFWEKELTDFMNDHNNYVGGLFNKGVEEKLLAKFISNLLDQAIQSERRRLLKIIESKKMEDNETKDWGVGIHNQALTDITNEEVSFYIKNGKGAIKVNGKETLI